MSGARVAKLGALFAAVMVIGCGGSSAGPSTAETCQNSICPQGAGAYKFCTAPHAASCRYVGSDGTTYACASCSNCQQAVQQITQWCSTQGGSSGGDCNSCSGTAQGTGGSCATQVAACQNDSSCATLATCLQGCSDSTCQSNCTSAAPAASQSKLNDILTCVCGACTTQCASECGGGGTTGGGTNGGGTNGGGTNGGGTTGGGSTCDSCQTTVLASGAACDSAASACANDTKCSDLLTCLNNCASGDMTCEQNCVNTAGQTALDEFNAVGDCICTNCATDCSAECGGSGGTTGGGTTGGGTTGGGTTGGGTTGGGTTGGGTTGGTTGGGTTGGGSAAACSTCEDSAFTGACQTQVDTCNASTACINTFNCVNACTYGDTACRDACLASRSSTTKTKYQAASDCLCQTACTNECSGVLPQCTP